MSETLRGSLSPEERVFGVTFRLSSGAVEDTAAYNQYVEDRIRARIDGQLVWLARTLDGEDGVVADYYKGRKCIATLVFDYDTRGADVYITTDNGQHGVGNVRLCEQVPFNDAVEIAEAFAGDPQIS